MTIISVVPSRNGELIVIDCMKTFTGHFCYTVKQKHDQFPDEQALSSVEEPEEVEHLEEIVEEDDDLLD